VGLAFIAAIIGVVMAAVMTAVLNRIMAQRAVKQDVETMTMTMNIEYVYGSRCWSDFCRLGDFHACDLICDLPCDSSPGYARLGPQTYST
jgi:hypothetical protein